MNHQKKTTTVVAEQAGHPGRCIETMFKITSGNNQRLSDMADNKAQILITVNSIILSAIISLLLQKLDTNHGLIIPTLIMLAVCLASIIFSILATRPSVPNGEFKPQQVANKTVNLLFFGNFYRMALEAYTDCMRQVTQDNDFLQGMLIKDVHTQARVLGKKYRLLRTAYNIFMFGLLAAVIAFAAASICCNPGHLSFTVNR